MPNFLAFMLLLSSLVTSSPSTISTLEPLSRSSCDNLCHCQDDIVSCPDNDLDNIPHDLNPFITKLELTGNSIKYISNMQFYPSLEDLDLSWNQINQIKSDSFSDSTELAVLNLNHNKMGKIFRENFEGLLNLGTLSISDNELDTISSDAFSSCPNLQTLDLSGNKLHNLGSNTFRGIKSTLRELNLARNLLGSIPKRQLLNFEHLTILDLSENQIKFVKNGDLEGISPGLMELRLSGCGLYSIGDSGFYGAASLKTLDLSNNGLSEAPNTAFKYLPLLETLHIGRNSVRSIRRSDFMFLGKLKYFYMDGCSGNSFSLEPGAFDQNTNLESISIRCPSLEYISDEVSLRHLPVLKNLSFHGSSLATLPRSLANFEDLHFLDLASNPLLCDCSLEFLYKLLTQPAPVEVRGYCQQPDELQDRQLIKVHESDYGCDAIKSDGEGNSVLMIGLGVVGVVILLAVIAVCIFRCWSKKPWNLSIHLHNKREPPKKRLSRTFSGDKRDIKVIQQKDLAGDDDNRFLPLRGLEYADPEYVNFDHNSNASEHLYVEVAEVTETVPKYNIPLTNVNCPDVKVSVI